jgi:DNA-binding MarR family transcriptional regulator
MSLKIYDSVARSHDLSPAEKFVLSYMQALKECYPKECYASIPKIAEKTALSRTHARRALKLLVGKDFFSRKQPNAYKAYRYTLDPPPEENYTIISSEVLGLPTSPHAKLLLGCLIRCDAIRESLDRDRLFEVRELADMTALHWKTVIRLLRSLRTMGWIRFHGSLPIAADSRFSAIDFTISPKAPETVESPVDNFSSLGQDVRTERTE